MNPPTDPARTGPRVALHDYMDQLAGEVSNVDLRDRVHAASRRATVRRRVAVGAAAALAVIAVASGIAVAGLPSAQRDRGTPVVGTTTPPAPTRPITTETPAGWSELPPTLYYQVRHDQGDTSRYDLWWSDFQTSEQQFRPPGKACGMFLSPDMTTVAWVAVDDTPGATGDLWISGLDGNAPRRLAYDVTCTGMSYPRWFDDTDLVFWKELGGRATVVETRTGKTADAGFPADVTDLVFSPNARYAAYGQDGKVVVCRADGTVIRRFAHGDETPTGGFTLQGISDDARTVVLGMNPSDPGHVRSGFRLVDTISGRNLELPKILKVTNPLSTEIYPAPGNQLLVRVDLGSHKRVFLLGEDGTVIDSHGELESLKDAQLLPPTSS
ncbi:hypothetical protein ACQP2F_33685 [Actinoplanes sp. CA-030573]|uniref:hypothetical protein n=1 Tax=Actinoplanes sp. CA-030573 TaxID=3239898 RepID=UPI003D8BAD7A